MNSTVQLNSIRQKITLGPRTSSIPSALIISNPPYPQRSALNINSTTTKHQALLKLTLNQQDTSLRSISTTTSTKNIKIDSPKSSPLKFPLRSMKSLTASDKTKLETSLNDLSSSQKLKWEELKLPMSPQEVLSLFSDSLPAWEQQEMSSYPDVYFIGKNFKSKEPNFDDKEGNYKVLIKDHIVFRYEVIGMIGKGSFGQVIEVFDHKTKKNLAVKIVKNLAKYLQQAKIEVEILQHIRKYDKSKSSNIIEILDSFTFRNHICIVFELYSLNLYELLKKNSFRGLSQHLIKKITLQLFEALETLDKCRIIHCDIKPENILLMNLTRPNIKLIDLGSSCFSSKRSRFYRAPEVILGHPYTNSIDIWSLGCVLFELFTGIPLFPGENEADQLLCIIEVLGLPPTDFIDKAYKKAAFFNETGEPILKISRGKRKYPGSKTIRGMMKGAENQLVLIIEQCLKWDPNERIKAEDALRNPYFTENGLNENKGATKHKKICLEDITKNMPNLQKFIADRKRVSEVLIIK